MPSTPFLGISVIVHLLVIATHRIFARIPYAKAGPRPVTRTTHFMAFVIVTVVFLGVLTNAYFLVRASVVSQYSSVHLIAKYVNFKSFSDRQIIFAYHPSPTPIPIQTVKKSLVSGSSEQCQSILNTISVAYDGSLVNYLFQHNNGDFSFEAREKLANKFNITPYIGSYEQNRQLWLKLIQQNKTVPGLDLFACTV